MTTYSLDLADRLTSFDPPSTAATTFGYDALGRIVTRVRPDGTDTYRFTGTSEQVAGISINVGGTGTAIASLVEPAGGRPLTKSGSTTYAALPDVTGSTAAVALNSTAVTGAVRFDAWGMPVAETTTGVGPFRYRGALELAPAGSDPLYESGARLYRPGLAAFTSLDTYAGSALEPASLNRYLYAQANPATLVDPSGHNPVCAIALAAGPAAPVVFGGCEAASFAWIAISTLVVGLTGCIIFCENDLGDTGNGPASPVGPVTHPARQPGNIKDLRDVPTQVIPFRPDPLSVPDPIEPDARCQGLPRAVCTVGILVAVIDILSQAFAPSGTIPPPDSPSACPDPSGCMGPIPQVPTVPSPTIDDDRADATAPRQTGPALVAN